MLERWDLVSALALALPPFRPPNLPSATAAGFLGGWTTNGPCAPVTAWTTENAV